MSLTAVVVLAAVFMSQVMGHWFKWHVIASRRLVDERGNLNRVPSYVYGLAFILAGFAVWVEESGLGWEHFWALARIVAAAGAGTVAPRVVEWWIERRAQLEELRERARER